MLALVVITALVFAHHFLDKIIAFTDKSGFSQKKHEILALQLELASISAQDEFSKWAKVNRKFESLKKEYALDASESQSHSLRIYATVNYGLYFFEILALIYWSAEPMFYMPNEWFGPLTSWLKFPFAPLGSVGAFYWWSALKSVLARVCKQ